MGLIKNTFYFGLGCVITYAAMNGGCHYVREHVVNGNTAEQALKATENVESTVRYGTKELFGANKPDANKPDANNLEGKVDCAEKK